jgi:GDP-L-fucose synthase
MSKSFLVTGATGLLGSEVLKASPNSIGISSRDCDLLSQASHNSFFYQINKARSILGHDVDAVIHCAARVGGVKANIAAVAKFFDDNVRINMNVLDGCKHAGVKLVSILSTCIYPDALYVSYPLTENQLHLGPPHQSNFGYAYAKRMLDIQSRTYRQQYGCNFICVIPNNLYGPNDNYHLEDGHVIPALMRRIWEAKLSSAPSVTVWGDGSPLREFTYAPDAARILKIVADEYDDDLPLNIGCTEERSIRDVAETLRDALGYEGEISYDTSKPMGQHRKPSSNRRLLDLTSWRESDYTPFKLAIRETCDWFMLQYPNVRGI